MEVPEIDTGGGFGMAGDPGQGEKSARGKASNHECLHDQVGDEVTI